MADGNLQITMSTDQDEKVWSRTERSSSILAFGKNRQTAKSPFDELRITQKQKKRKKRRQSDSVLSNKVGCTFRMHTHTR